MLMISHAQGQSQEVEDVTFVLEGIWNNSPINASGSIGAGEKNVPVTLLIEMFGAKTNIDGTVQDPKEFKGVDLDIRVAGEKLSDLNMVAGSFPPIGPYTLAANLRDSGKDTYTLDNFQAHIAESDLTGTLTFEKAERPRLTADLTSTLLDLDALLTKPENAATKEAESDAPGRTTQGAGEAGETERLFPDTPLDLSSLNKADADVSLKVAELRYGGLALRDAVVGVNLERGVLQITPLQAGLAEGVVDCELRLDSRANPAKLQLAMNVTEGNLAAIKPMFNLSEVVSGPLDLAGSVLGTVLLGPFGVLIPCVRAGSWDDNSCVSAPDNPQENLQPTNQAPASPTDAVEDAVENLLGIFD